MKVFFGQKSRTKIVMSPSEDGTECYELAGLYLLNQLKDQNIEAGLYTSTMVCHPSTANPQQGRSFQRFG